jgi:DNA-binding NtrC family response regulator
MGTRPKPILRRIVALGDAPEPDRFPLEDLAGEVLRGSDVEEAVSAAREAPTDLAVIRETVEPADGVVFLAEIRRLAPCVPVVVLSAEADLDSAILLARHGAKDYICGPLDEEARDRIATAAAPTGPKERGELFFAPECPPDAPIAGQSDAIRDALRTIGIVAESRCNPVLIVGETGTGKELAARAVHALRGGDDDTFVAVNCATLTANLLESELFGHVKGAFTGADRDKTGLFEVAGTGTLFLDEISEMPAELQAKLLRVLQERRFRKVGGTKDIPCRATIVASSNRNLAEEAREGRFRRDLYYRLAVFPVELPPLRDTRRRADIPLLARYFLETAASEGERAARELTPEAEEKLAAHSWPGNVRELRNVVERALILETSDRIGPESLLIDGDSGPEAPKESVEVPEDDFSLETAERLFITRALQETGWQRTRAAALLGITRATLHAKLKRYNIATPESRPSRRTSGATSSSNTPSRNSRLAEVAV